MYFDPPPGEVRTIRLHENGAINEVITYTNR